MCRSPSISTFTATTRPVSANQLFSIPVRSELCVKCSPGPGQLNTSESVTVCIVLASAGGVEGSFFTVQRCSPWLSRHSHGDSKVTDSCVAAPQTNATAASVKVWRVTATVHISLSLRRREQRRQYRIACEILANLIGNHSDAVRITGTGRGLQND